MTLTGFGKIPLWLWLGSAIPLGWSLFVFAIAPEFAWNIRLADRPVDVFLVVICVSSAVFFLFALAMRHRARSAKSGDYAAHLMFIIAIGLIARALLFPGPAVLEDDFYRYHWDGQVTAAGLNPYAGPPAEFVTHPVLEDLLAELGQEAEPVPREYEEVAEQGRETLLRVNNPHISTIYSPLTQLAFAAAQIMTPWQDTGWKLVILISEILCLGALVAALRQMSQPVYLAAIYWWNPLVLKELSNSMHMDALLMPFLAGMVWLCAARRQRLMALGTAVAAAIKIWPLLILPALWRKSGHSLFWGMVAGALVLMLLGPQLVAMTESSGLARYAADWQRNSLAFPILLEILAPYFDDPAGVGRMLTAALLAMIALGYWVRPSQDPEDLLAAAGTLILLLCLLSPTGYPWYTLWILPFAVVMPRTPWLLLTACAPFYYLGFWLQAHGWDEDWSWVTGLLSAGPVWLYLLTKRLPVSLARRVSHG
ncbi:MAG: glycosyltransferase 87 family protein [Pseudomonadota bacterium]